MHSHERLLVTICIHYVCVHMCPYVCISICVCIEEIDVIGSSQDASTDSDADDADDTVLSANKAFTMSLRLSRPL